MSQYLEILQNNLPKLFAVFSIFTVSFYTYIWYKIAANFENVPQKKHDSYESIPLSILIPFRNEADRIIPLLDSILQLRNKNGLEFIFIDDHSSDNTKIVIEKHPIFSQINCKIIQLKSNEIGKKMAIIYGIKEAYHPIILTTDADCEFQTQTIDELFATFNTYQSNLLVGPVFFKTNQNNLIQIYQKIENTVLVALGFYQNNSKTPTMANGANLMYKKSVFLQLNPFNNNMQITGGDDIFTLEAFYRYDAQKVHWTTHSNAAVYTSVLKTWHELWLQRIRWVKKTKFQNTKNTAKSQIFLAIFFMIFWGSTIYSVVYNHYEIAATLWLGKAISDIFSIRIIFNKFNQHIQNSEIISASVIQNFFIPILGLVVPFQKVHWKKRTF